MKVLSLYYTHKPGGFCKRLYRLMNALSSAGHTVIYLSLDDPGKKLSSNLSFIRIPFPCSKRSGALFWGCFIIWCPVFVVWTCLKERPTQLFVFGAFYSAMCLPARYIFRLPLTLFLRSLVFRINEITGKSRVEQQLSLVIDRVGIKAASKVVVMSNAMQEEMSSLIRIDPEKIALLPNDLPVLEMVSAVAKKDECILAGGVLDERKNLALLIDAFSKLSLPSVKLKIAGEGPLIETLKHNAPPHCEFLGWVQEMRPLLQESAILVHPSLHEGAPNIVLEALALGVPVLVSDIPEHREIISFPALRFDPHDPDGLRDKLRKFFSDPGFAKQVRECSSKCAEEFKFDWDKRAVELVLK